MKRIKWIGISVGLWLLKKSLHSRLTGEGAAWIQHFPKTRLVVREQFILQQLTGKSVFHIGFVDAPFTLQKLKEGSLLHQKLKQVCSRLIGLDTNVSAVQLYETYTGDNEVLVASLKDINAEVLQQYEYVLAGEILEHLINPVQLIDELDTKMKPGQHILITVPNYTSLDSIAAALHETESVHSDHQWYFSPYTLLSKFNDACWKLCDFYFGNYGEAPTRINFIKQQYPATGDCLIACFQKK